MTDPIVYGPALSAYVRSARLALEEKQIAYKLIEVDMFAGAHKAPEHLARHPFGKVPAFEHGGVKLYETIVINRYIDEAFPGPPLQPADLGGRTRMNLALAVIDNYAYPSMISNIVIQRLAPMRGGNTDEDVVQRALPEAEASLRQLEKILGKDSFLAGTQISLADLQLLPIMSYFCGTPEGKSLLADAPGISYWWATLSERASVIKTQPKLS